MVQRRLLLLSLGFLFVSSAHSADPATPEKPAQIYRAARDFIREGRYDVAAEQLKAFLASSPSDKDFLDLQKAEPTIFLKLRNVAVWSDDLKTHNEAVATVNKIIERSEEAARKLYRDPARITQFVKNLGATVEERVYAEDQLKHSGDAVPPILIEVLRTNQDADLRTGIIGVVSKLGIETVPGILAATDGLPNDIKILLFKAILSRSDTPILVSTAETDFLPYLWYYSAAPGDGNKTLREYCTSAIHQVSGPSATRRQSDVELVRFATTFVDRTARFRSERPRVWSWDAGRFRLNASDVPTAAAEEYFAMRYLRWALERNDKSIPAQERFVALAVERAVERAGFGDMAKNDPELFRLLASAPSDLLVRMLEQAMLDGRTGLVLGLTQQLAVRIDKLALLGSPNRPAVLVKALDYPDPRVQLAAAIGILQSPAAPTHGKTARIVDILKRSVILNGETAKGGNDSGVALVCDPDDRRSEQLSQRLLTLGYTVERFPSGKALRNRIARTTDHDLILLDRHAVEPTLEELLPRLTVDTAALKRPILVVASGDRPAQLPLEHLVLRLALLIAAADAGEAGVVPPFAVDFRKAEATRETDRAATRKLRDQQLAGVYDVRLERLKRLTDAVGLAATEELSKRMELRLPQATYAVLAAEYPISEESAPEMTKKMANQTLFVKNRPNLVVPSQALSLDELARVVERMDTNLSEVQKKLFEKLSSKIDVSALDYPVDHYRDEEMETKLRKMANRYNGVSVIPEPYSVVGFSEELRSAVSDPARRPRRPEEKRAATKVALEWLRRLSSGETAGYDVQPAETVLRGALRDDELADAAIEALARIPGTDCQQDLLAVALTTTRPAALRLKAAERTIRHVQAFGNLIPANRAEQLATLSESEPNNEIKAQLLVLRQTIGARSSDLSGLIRGYHPPAEKAAPKVEKPKDEQPKDEQPKDDKGEAEPAK